MISFFLYIYFLLVLLPPVCCPPEWKGSAGSSGGLCLAPSLSPPSWQGGRAALPAPIPGARCWIWAWLGAQQELLGEIEAGDRGRVGFKAGTSQLSQNPFLGPGPPISVLLIPDSAPSVPASPPLLQLPKWDFRDLPGPSVRGHRGSVLRDTFHPRITLLKKIQPQEWAKPQGFGRSSAKNRIFLLVDGF